MTERPKRPKESGPLSGLAAQIQMGGHKAGSAPRRRYYDPGAHPAPRKLPPASRFSRVQPPAQETDRQLKKALKKEKGIKSGRQLKRALRELRRQLREERDTQRKLALAAAAGVVVDAPEVTP